MLTLDLGGGVALEMVRVKAGKFRWGRTRTTVNRRPTRSRVHEVALTKDFSLAKHPVTKKQFARFVAATKYVTSAEKAEDGGFGVGG